MKTQTPVALVATQIAADEIVRQLALELCHIATYNTRHPEPKDVRELSLSVGKIGQTTPGIVRPHPTKKGHFEIGAGARRRVACEVAKRATFAAVVREYNDADFEELILVENLQRVDPDPRAEIDLLDRLNKRGVRTLEEISAHLGKPEHWVRRRLQLLKVIPELRKAWGHNGQNGINHFTVEMMSLVGSLPVETQKQFTTREAWNFRRCTSRPELSKFLEREVLCQLSSAPFDLADNRFFVPGCGPGCAQDSSMFAGLFDFEGKDKACARCLNPACFRKRVALATKARFDEVTKGEKEELPVVKLEYHAPDVLDIASRKVNVTDMSFRGLGHTLPDKPTPGATKVLLVGNEGAMSIAYLPKQSSNGSAKKVVSSGARLKARKEILQGKRWLVVHADLLKALNESKHTACVENVVDLVAVFGLPYHSQSWFGDKTWKQFDARKRAGFPLQAECAGYVPEYSRSVPKAKGCEKSREEALWHGLKVVLAGVMKPSQRVGDVPKSENAMRRVAKLIKFPIDARKRAADLEIKAPRSWGHVDPHTLEPCAAPAKAKAQGLSAAMRKRLNAPKATAKKKAKATQKKSPKKAKSARK